MRYSDRNAGEEHEHAAQHQEVLHWAAAIDDTGVPSAPLPCDLTQAVFACSAVCLVT